MSLASGAAFLVVLWELNFESPFCWIYNHHLKWLWVFYILCFPWCLDQFVQSLAFPLTSVDVYVHIICRLSKYSRLSGWLTTFFVDSRNFAALMFPSLLVITSTILPDFHEPLGKSSLSWQCPQSAMFHSLRFLVTLTSVSTFLEGLIGNHFVRSSKMIPVVFVLFSIFLTRSILTKVDMVRNQDHPIHLRLQ